MPRNIPELASRPTSTKSRRGDGNGHAPIALIPTVGQRLARIEATMIEVQRTLEIQFQRIAAMQAQVDHLAARKNS